MNDTARRLPLVTAFGPAAIAPQRLVLRDARRWIVLLGMSMGFAALLATLPSGSNVGTPQRERSVVRC